MLFYANYQLFFYVGAMIAKGFYWLIDLLYRKDSDKPDFKARVDELTAMYDDLSLPVSTRSIAYKKRELHYALDYIEHDPGYLDRKIREFFSK